MEVIIQPSERQATELAAQRIARLLRDKPGAVLGLATCRSQKGVYEELVRMHREEGLDFSEVTTFNLHEYIGLGPEHPGSFRHYMQEHLFGGVNVDLERVHVPDGMAQEVDAHCSAYEAAIAAAGGIDLQLLGIGSDGHIGFNEPSSSLSSPLPLPSPLSTPLSSSSSFFKRRTTTTTTAATMATTTSAPTTWIQVFREMPQNSKESFCSKVDTLVESSVSTII